MRKRARTDLRGGRPVKAVPTATRIVTSHMPVSGDLSRCLSGDKPVESFPSPMLILGDLCHLPASENPPRFQIDVSAIRACRGRCVQALNHGVGSESGLSNKALFCRDRNEILRVQAPGNAVFDPRHELRGEALHHLPDVRLKCVKDTDTRVAANRRTKIVECRRSRSCPIRTVRGVDSGQSQHSEEIRSV
jgi:hypothetical protein